MNYISIIFLSLSPSIYIPNILTYSGGVSGSLLSLLIKGKGGKGTDVGSPWPGARGSSIKDTATEGACIEGICIAGTCIASPCARGLWVKSICNCAGGACIRAWGACTGSTYTKDASNRATSDKDTCIGSFCLIEHKKMHLQSFQIFELRGGFELKIRVELVVLLSMVFGLVKTSKWEVLDWRSK